MDNTTTNRLTFIVALVIITTTILTLISNFEKYVSSANG